MSYDELAAGRSGGPWGEFVASPRDGEILAAFVAQEILDWLAKRGAACRNAITERARMRAEMGDPGTGYPWHGPAQITLVLKRKTEPAGNRVRLFSVLLAHHQALVDASGIARTVQLARGYESATKRTELERLGFGPKQRSVPALIVPVWNVHGERVLTQIRPDNPRVVDGKALKYETPVGASLIVDCPPAVRPMLRDPSIPLFVTEGARKADAAVTRGLACVALLGVWAWRGKNEHGGKAVLPCWDAIALNGRDVYVVFDSDVMEKQAVHLAMARLKGTLEGKKASVRFAYLPAGEGGKKTGLDDYFARQDTSPETLRALASHQLRELPLDVRAEGKRIEGPVDAWLEMDGRTVEAKAGEEGGESYHERFAGIARVVREERRWQEDDEQPTGWKEDRRVTYRFELASGEAVTKQLEPGPLPFMAVLEKELPDANSCHSATERSKMFQFVARKSAEEKVVIESRRALGPHGDLGWLCAPSWAIREGRIERTDYAVEPPPGASQDLKRYRLAELTQSRFVEVARFIVDELLRCDHADQAYTLPLLGASLVAPIWAYVPTFASWQRYGFFIQGPSGIGKTQLTRYFMSFWGDFLGADGLSTWRDTTTTVEDLLHRVVGAPVFVCDWKRANFGKDEEKRARALIQAYADRSARGRSSQRAETQKKKHPRCQLVMDGEDLPEGQESTLGRLVIMEARAAGETRRCATAHEGSLDPAMVKDLPGVTARFIAWVQRNVATLTHDLAAAHAGLDDALPHGSTNRSRVVRNYAAQLLAVRSFGLFLEQEAGMEGVMESLEARSFEVHVEQASRQLSRVVSQSAGQLFLEGLRAVLLSGEGTLRAKPGEGADWEPFGRALGASRAVGVYSAVSWTASVWPSVALPMVQAHVSKGGGERIEFSRGAILQQLEQEGLLVGMEDERPRAVDRLGVRGRAWVFPLDVLGLDRAEVLGDPGPREER